MFYTVYSRQSLAGHYNFNALTKTGSSGFINGVQFLFKNRITHVV